MNLAVRIGSVADASVALVDLDLQRGDVAAFLNLTPLQSIATISAARSEVDEIFLHGTMTRHPSGVHVLPAPVQIEEADIVSQEDVVLVLDLLRTQFRYAVVDTPRTINGPCLAALENADRVLVLTDLSVPGVRAAQRTVELFARLSVPSTRVELLVTDSAGGPVALKDAVRAIGKEPLLIIPRDESAAREAMNAGAPVERRQALGIVDGDRRAGRQARGRSRSPRPSAAPFSAVSSRGRPRGDVAGSHRSHPSPRAEACGD